MQNMTDLFLHFLKDMYYAEQQVLRFFPELIRAAQNDALKKAFSSQAEATRTHVQTLEKIFEAMGRRPEGITCEAVLGLLKESEDLLKDLGSASPIQDAGLIACVQALQHYAIARYGALAAWAIQAGQQQAATLLKQVLDTAKQADGALNQLATDQVSKSASATA
jgi:ferritin-like metal-binding protein YciE